MIFPTPGKDKNKIRKNRSLIAIYFTNTVCIYEKNPNIVLAKALAESGMAADSHLYPK